MYICKYVLVVAGLSAARRRLGDRDNAIKPALQLELPVMLRQLIDALLVNVARCADVFEQATGSSR